MNWNGLDVTIKNKPALDAGFLPMMAVLTQHQEHVGEGKQIAIAMKRADDACSLYKMRIHSSADLLELDKAVVERVVKFLLWMKGGYEITIYGSEELGAHIKEQYQPGGAHGFDAKFMAGVYETEFCVLSLPYAELVPEKEAAMKIGGHHTGCRIGFDAGGSDRKVSAVIDGEAVFSEEVVWHPKTNADPEYHYEGILSALQKAKGYLPRVDAIGVSSAGIYINNRCMVASLFRQVPKDLFEAKVKDIYLRAAKEIGASVQVVNDGDVAALAGALSLECNNILGIAMGTSEAAGFVDQNGNIKGWLNELAFAPVDLSSSGAEDDWSHDIGCGGKYFSQDAAIRLANQVGVSFADDMSPGEMLKQVQDALVEHPEQVFPLYETVGAYLGHSLALYHHFYGMEHVLLMGRMMSGEGGGRIVEVAQKVLREEYPQISKQLQIHLPDERSRRVGQSVAAASL